MAFDRSGNLWIAEGNLNINPSSGNYSGRIVAFSAAQLAALAATPNPAPFVTLTAAGAVYGVAFDPSGNFWASAISFINGGALVEFTPTQLASTGSPASPRPAERRGLAL